MTTPLSREPLTYGELMMLCEGHGTSQIYERHTAIVEPLRQRVEELEHINKQLATHEVCSERDALAAKLAAVERERDKLKNEVAVYQTVYGGEDKL